MRNRTLWMIVGLLSASLALSACSGPVGVPAASTKEAPYTLEKIDGSDFNLVVLTEKAAQRLVLEIGKVSEQQVAGAQRTVVPYASLIYGLHGETWVYVSPQPLSFH